MRKILLSLAALLTAGVAWAQTVVTAINTEKYYTLECRSGAAHNTSRFIGDNGTVINGQSSTASYFVFEEAGAENSYYIKSYKTGKYINHNGTNISASTEKTTAWTFGVGGKDNVAGVVTFTIGNDKYLNNNGSDCADGTCSSLKANTHSGGPAAGNACSLWEMREYATPYEEVTVKYSFKYNGREVATQSVVVLESSEYPAITISLPYGITATKPEGTVSAGDAVDGVITKEIVLAKEKDLPFETAATADEITKWYYMRMHTNQPGFIGDIAEDNTINVAWGKTAEENTMDNFLWGFVGSDAFGITVVNKGTGKQLVSTGDGNVTLTDAGTSFFVANTGEKTNKAKYGFCLRKSDSNNYINANYGAKKLSHWSSADAGSTIFVYEEETSAEVTVSDAGYATVCIDYPVSIPENVEVYTVTTVEGSSAKMTKIEGVLPENTGVIVKAAAGDYDFSISALPVSATNGNLLKGTVVDTDVTAEANTTYYVLSNPENGPVGFYKAALTDNKFKNNANKAYLPITNQTESSARFLSFDFGTETAIESIEGAEVESAVVYDLSGRRVQKAQKGLYIVNGKKVVK